jgi:hypothetical protein
MSRAIRIEKAARDLLYSMGGDPPDWLRAECAALERALAAETCDCKEGEYCQACQIDEDDVDEDDGLCSSCGGTRGLEAEDDLCRDCASDDGDDEDDGERACKCGNPDGPVCASCEPEA